jgi:putative ABC transport system permease protein
MIFGLTPHDPMTLVMVSAVLLGIAGMATLFPSLRAAKTNPAIAMRSE